MRSEEDKFSPFSLLLLPLVVPSSSFPATLHFSPPSFTRSPSAGNQQSAEIFFINLMEIEMQNFHALLNFNCALALFISSIDDYNKYPVVQR
jgi:hypothetical protein